jgi:2-polyprenyl-6-methoxyphenol hydroxylase-like FAD-dependent oxidoreductase
LRKASARVDDAERRRHKVGVVPRSILIVGGGIAGMSAAILLARTGARVDLIELDAHWKVTGAGITITGPTLRAMQTLGVLDEIRALGYTGNGIRVCAIDGSVIAELATPSPKGTDIEGSGGIMRPVLHRILSQHALSRGTNVTLGVTIDSLQQDLNRVHVQLSNGVQASYDLVIGADGLHSSVRKLLLSDAPTPEYTGQCIWRVAVPRPKSIDRRHFFLGGPVKVGLSPVSKDEMYMFLLETRRAPGWMTDERAPVELARLLEGYGGALRDIRNGLNASSRIVFRPLEAFFLPAPWHRGNVVLIGDAAHPTSPQLASGAGMAIEDAIVLAEELERATEVAHACDAFMRRRYERCRLVVENSLEIGRREQRGASVESQTSLVEQSLRALAEPI